jgi:AbrB family looped-hinge helix DNA binding protein
MQTTCTVRVRNRGQITLPRSVRTSLAVDAGDTLNLIQVGDVVLLSLRQAQIPRLAQEFTTLMQEEGVSLGDLLYGLHEERKEVSW